MRPQRKLPARKKKKSMRKGQRSRWNGHLRGDRKVVVGGGVPGRHPPVGAVGQTSPREAERLRRRSTDTERLREGHPGRGERKQNKNKRDGSLEPEKSRRR